MRRRLIFALVLLGPCPAWAGAWTADPDGWLNISGVILSDSGRNFGSAAPLSFRHALLQTYTEYGWQPDMTLLFKTETSYVEVTQNGAAPYHAFDNAFEAGARWRFDPFAGWSDFGVFALEVTLRTAGAFNFAVSANRTAGGNGAQLRLLYGRGFKLWDMDGYVDLQAGESFLSGGRADETPLDFTAGLWLDNDNLAMLQSFNLFAGPGSLAAYPAFESHKLQLSWVRRITHSTSIQAGGFFSPIGHNALVEQGVCLSLWLRF